MIDILMAVWGGILFFLKWYGIFFGSLAAISTLLVFHDKRLIKAPVMVTLWGLFGLVKITTALSGFAVGPLLYRYRKTVYSDLPFWTRPWANPEDWLGQQNHYMDGLPRWWYDKFGTGFKSWYGYNITRNPANGLRSFESLDLDIVPSKVEFTRSENFSQEAYWPYAIRASGAKTVWYVAWQGLQAGAEIVHIWNDERHLNIKMGWRVEPSDSNPDLHHGIGSNDASFASKVLPYRKG